MALLQPNLSLKVSQRQVLTPGLMQMVSVLALNKLELKEMIDAEMVENPVLEEINESVPMLDEVAGREEQLARGAEEPPAPPKDSFEEIDFGSYFRDYLDPGYRTQPEFDDSEKPSFEHFLSQPTTLSDHLAWQLGELAAAFFQADENDGAAEPGDEAITAALDLLRRAVDLVRHLDPAGVGARDLRECLLIQIAAQQDEFSQLYTKHPVDADEETHRGFRAPAEAQIEERRRCMEVAASIVDQHLQLLQKRDVKDLARMAHITPAEANAVSVSGIAGCWWQRARIKRSRTT